MVLNWMKGDYFAQLMMRDKRSHTALEMLVDDLHSDKERTINRFLCHSGSEDFLWGLVRLLGNENARVAGNAAYILGTLAESETGCYRVISLTGHTHPESRRILLDLTNMLRFEDAESVMNAAGTMGTLAESQEGRMWMLSEPCLDKTIQNITELLTSDNLWTASNAALVLARLTIAEEGCEKILQHVNSEHVLSRLIHSLGVDEAGRGMNAAFAIGRLCDLELGRNYLLGLPESERMISLLAKMLCCSDAGASKNACFALSCLATSKEGHARLLKNAHSEDVLRTLSELLSSEDNETGWFSAMTLRTLASQPRGCLRLRDHPSVLPALKAIEARTDLNSDLYEEVLQTAEILKRLEKPQTPRVEVLGAHDIMVEWDLVATKSGFVVRYQLFEGNKCVFTGKELRHQLRNLHPHTAYTFRLRAFTEGDDSPLSESVTVSTEESTPGPPTNLRIIGCTTTQLKIGWDPPDQMNGISKGFYVYNGEKGVEHTYELNSIISGLQASTAYEISVCAATSKGKGPRDTVQGHTTELGAHAPAKPEVTVRGRNELHVSWKPPENPLGKTTRYDVRLNGEVMYSGMDLHYVVRRLKPDTEYVVTVSAITNEGKCESKPTKKRTSKDDFEGERAPLYAPPRKDVVEQQEKKEEVLSKSPPRKRKESIPKARSASAASVKAHMEARKSRAKDDKTDSSPEGSRPVSNNREREESRKSDSADGGNVLYLKANSSHHEKQLHRSQNSSSIPRPRTHKASEGSDVTKPVLPPSTTPSSEHKQAEKAKTLPKPKPPVIKRNKRGSVPVSTSSGTPDASSRSNSGSIHAPRAKQSQEARPKSEKQITEVERMKSNTPVQEEVKSQAQSSIHTRTRGLKERDWSTGKLASKKSILKKRSSSDAVVEAGETLEEVHDVINIARRIDQPQTQSTVTKTFSTFNAGNFHPSEAMTRQKTGLVEFDAPLPQPSQTSGMTPSYVQRANTFIAQHRPGLRRSIERETRMSQPQPVTHNPQSMIPSTNQWTPNVGVPMSTAATGLPGNSHPQWTPDFPQPRTEKAHGKFVPMQYRTQPANLPGGIKRQGTSIGNIDKAPMEVMARSKTDMGYQGNSGVAVATGHLEAHSEETRVGSLTGQRERLSSSKPVYGSNIQPDEGSSLRRPAKFSGSPRIPVRNAPGPTSQSQHTVIKLGVGGSINSNSLQSAR